MNETTERPRSSPFRILVILDAPTAPGVPAKRSFRLDKDNFDEVMSGNAGTRELERLSVERAWRSLRFLVDRMDFRQELRLDVAAAPKSAAATAVREYLHDPELAAPSDEPVSLIVADYELDATSGDMALLSELADQAMDLYAPVVAGVNEAFFGVANMGELARVKSVRSLFDDAAHEEWRAFRKSEASRWVVLACNRFLLRGDTGAAPPLYGNAAYLVAVVCARRFAELRWCSQISGPQAGAIGNLPVQRIETAGREATVPVEAILPEQITSDLGDCGLVVAVARPNSDAAHVLRAPTTHEPERYNVPAETEQSRLRATLEHQLFVGRLAQQLEALASAAAGLDPAALEALFEQAVAGMLKLAGRAAEDAQLAVKVVPSKDRDDRNDVIVNVRPGKLILGGRLGGVLLTFRVMR